METKTFKMKHVIITGTSGMVGKGVLLECLEDPRIEKVLVINRKSIAVKHPKLEELILPNFNDLSGIQTKLKNYHACFFCTGVSAAGMNEEKYTQITYSITKIFVDTLYALQPKMVFNYVSGEGTDSSEQGKTMWARVKGKTENMVFNRGFADAYAIRAGVIIPEKGVTSNTKWYKVVYVILRPFFPLLKKMKNVTTTPLLGKAMINTLFFPSSKKIIHNPEINELARFS